MIQPQRQKPGSSGNCSDRRPSTWRRRSWLKRQRSEPKTAVEPGLGIDLLEDRLMLSQMLPDMFAWASESRGYLYDYYVSGNLLRFSTAFANQGAGHLELRGGQVLGDGTQEVYQRIFNDDGSYSDRLAGAFTYHQGHGHIHFDGYAIYNLRANVNGQVGPILRSGGKISFCLIDITRYDPNAGSSRYNSCGQVQGVSAGWSDVYSSGLTDQYIDITGIADGDYFLEVIADPDDQLLESDETNNTTIIPVTITGGPGAQGDVFEPNNSFAEASNLGLVTQREEVGLSIHSNNDVDYYRFTAADDGSFHVVSFFDNNDGNLDLFVYDANQNLIGSSTTTGDGEHVDIEVVGGQDYFVLVRGVNGAMNGYILDLEGPGEIFTQTVSSSDVPVQIPDSPGASTPGTTVISTLQGPDIEIADLNLVINDLRHTYLGDLHIDLTSPAGTTQTILRSNWESGGGLLGSQDNFINTRLDDQAPVNLGDGNAPFSGTFNVDYSTLVVQPLTAFNGENAEGIWTISITDWYSADTGVLNAWSIEFTGVYNHPPDIYEDNNAFPQAYDFGVLGSRVETGLTIHDATDRDMFRFLAGANSVADIDITFSHAEGDLELIAYDANLAEIGRSNGSGDQEHLSFPVVGGDLYYFEINGVGTATNVYDLTIDVAVPIGESGSLPSVTDQWQVVALNHTYINPVVLVAAQSQNDAEPFVVQVQNVTASSFEVRIAEWDYLDGVHNGESVGYFVIEAGRHVLDDGTVLEAGVQTASTMRQQFTFSSSFDTRPVVIAQPLIARTDQPVSVRMDRVRLDRFFARLQPEEALSGRILRGKMNWLAIEVAQGTHGITDFEAATAASVSNNVFGLSFQQTYFANTVVLATAQSHLAADPFDVRVNNITGIGADLWLQEETSQDSEVSHFGETVGYAVFGQGVLFGPRPISKDSTADSAAEMTAEWEYLSTIHNVGPNNPLAIRQALPLPKTIELTKWARNEQESLVSTSKPTNAFPALAQTRETARTESGDAFWRYYRVDGR